MIGAWLADKLSVAIPRWIKPNWITYANHCLHWTMLLCAYHCREDPSTECLLAVAAMNGATMILDSLDGAHARATDQCTLEGEMLDHVLDAAHTPIVASTAAIVMGMPVHLVAVHTILAAAVYHSQVLWFLQSEEFTPTNGEESQLAVSALIVAYAYADRELLLLTAHWLSPIVALLSMMPFLLRLNATYIRDMAMFVTYHSTMAGIMSACNSSTILYAMMASIATFLITGGRVVEAIDARDRKASA